nr:MAG TPA: hypothetical protein [Caudoviricetes sp.]
MCILTINRKSQLVKMHKFREKFVQNFGDFAY